MSVRATRKSLRWGYGSGMSKGRRGLANIA